MVKTAIDPPAELQRAASLLFKNWMLAIPTAAASLIIGIIQVFFIAGIFATALVGGAVAGRGGAGIAAILAALPLLAVFFVVAVLLTLIAQAVVVHASEDVWEDRGVDLARSFSVALGRLAALIGAFLLVLLIMIIPIALCFVIIGIPLVLIALYFLMYVVPAIVLGNESPTGAIGASYRIARENVGPSLFALLGIVVAIIIGAIVEGLFGRAPSWLQLLVALIVGGFTSAYAALVAARFYTLLRPQTSLAAPPPA
jgi:hypothetical protein